MHYSGVLAVVSTLVASGAAHSLLSTPPTRGNTKWWGTCAAGAGCKGPCDSPKADSPFNSIYVPKTYIQRGQELDVGWSRLNHPGGFVRLAMVPFNQSDSWSAFNDNVLKYTCYETNCGPSNPADTTFGHLNGGGSSPCSTKVTVPKNIPDNTAVTLQWIWYGGGIYYGQPDTSFGEYYSCSDLIVSGGPFSDEKPVAEFKGGDVTYPGSDKCKYWGSNKVGDCNFGDRVPNAIEGDLLSQSLEPCIRGPELSGRPYGFESGSPAAPASPSANYNAPSSVAGAAAASSPAPPVAHNASSDNASSSAAAPSEPAPPAASEPAASEPASPAPIYSEAAAATTTQVIHKCKPRPTAAF
ncbi:hypothetical protein GGI07_002707 [Coemansia sp. Benny D115]|nr:hypothetical protein GGI07_002707 [Coemansia sp. Benny D115]